MFETRVSYTLGDVAFLSVSPLKVHRRRELSLEAGRELIGDASFQPVSPLCQRRRDTSPIDVSPLILSYIVQFTSI